MTYRADYTLTYREPDGSLTTVDVLPTPMLLDQFGRPDVTVEAYETDPPSDRYPAIWRMRDDDYDPPGVEYRVVVSLRRKPEPQWPW